MTTALDQIFVAEPDAMAVASALRELRHACFATPRIDSDAVIALHALDAIADDALDDAIAGDAALAEAERQYRELVGELCLAGPPAMPGPHVRARLFASVSADAS
jgi:hypothetical protein